MLTNQQKHDLAEAVFQDFDFAPDVVAETDGWESFQGGNVFSRTVFLENPNGPSIAKKFVVTVNEDDNNVAADMDDQHGEWDIDSLLEKLENTQLKAYFQEEEFGRFLLELLGNFPPETIFHLHATLHLLHDYREPLTTVLPDPQDREDFVSGPLMIAVERLNMIQKVALWNLLWGGDPNTEQGRAEYLTYSTGPNQVCVTRTPS